MESESCHLRGAVNGQDIGVPKVEPARDDQLALDEPCPLRIGSDSRRYNRTWPVLDGVAWSVQPAKYMSKQIEASKRYSHEEGLSSASSNAAERDPLIKAVDHLQSEIHRLENRFSQLENQFHSFTIRNVVGDGDRLQLAMDTAKRIEEAEARLTSRKPPSAQKRPRRGASQRRKAA
jgi:hypothetical protein